MFHLWNHKLLDKSDFRSTRSQAGSLPSFPTQRCDEHKSEVLNMYCQNHDEVACATCIALHHRSCRNVCSIPENIDKLSKRSEMSNVEQSIQLTRTQMEETKQSKEAHKQLLTKSLDTVVDSVKTFKQELQTLLDEIENDTIIELKKQFVCLKTFEKMTKRRETEMNKQQSQTDETVTFDADQSIKSFLQNLKVFGKITCQLSSIPKTRLAVKSHPNSHTATRPKNTLYKVTKQREVHIKLPGDTDDCYILGSCITDDGFLHMADYSNSKLKRLNMTTETVTDYFSLISPPRAVCQVSKTEAAVSLYNKTVQFVKLGDKLTATRTLTFNHDCWVLAYSNGKLYISDRGNSVYICDNNGKELRKITTDASGKDIFKEARNIAISADGSRVFVADYFKRLITLDIQGNYLSTLSEKEIQVSDCWGVCTDVSNVFVSGYWSNNIVQIGQDHKLVGQIANITLPLSVCFDSRKRRLYVTKDGSNNVSVLELV